MQIVKIFTCPRNRQKSNVYPFSRHCIFYFYVADNFFQILIGMRNGYPRRGIAADRGGGGKNILFQMGAVIPIDKTDDKNFWFAQIPINHGGNFRQITVKIPKDDTVHKNFLPCTTNNFIKQSFKFLGDVYGWGGLKDSVDCSAFTSDVYRSMGIEIPRDADRQNFYMPSVAKFHQQNYDERIKILKKSPTGALLFKPGHVLIFLGNDADGTPIAIHAASSYYLDDKKIYVSKVLVSAMSYPNDYGVSTVEKLNGISFAR